MWKHCFGTAYAILVAFSMLFLFQMDHTPTTTPTPGQNYDQPIPWILVTPQEKSNWHMAFYGSQLRWPRKSCSIQWNRINPRPPVNDNSIKDDNHRMLHSTYLQSHHLFRRNNCKDITKSSHFWANNNNIYSKLHVFHPRQGKDEMIEWRSECVEQCLMKRTSSNQRSIRDPLIRCKQQSECPTR